MVIIYFIITVVSLYFVITTIVHSRSTHVIANKMEKQFEHYFHEDAHQNDRSSSCKEPERDEEVSYSQALFS